MPNPKPIPTLLHLMFGEAAPLSLDSASERLLALARAFDDWLESKRSNRDLYNGSHSAWKQLLALVRKPPLAMTG
jgi:hypothetical protein